MGRYVEGMGETWGIALRAVCSALLLLGLICAAPTAAQQTADDAAAREYFERGRSAFEEADYEGALVYFRHAYRLSHREELQYNIGVAADRLQREEEALEAFEHYLDESEDAARADFCHCRLECVGCCRRRRHCCDERWARKERFVFARSWRKMRDRELGDGVDVGVRRHWRRSVGSQCDVACAERKAQQRETPDTDFRVAHGPDGIRNVLKNVSK
jgi:tetratricopeptide (TPR) repeat protein